MPKIIIENNVFRGIPYNEYYKEKTRPKGLIFVQHGFESNKNRGGDYIALPLAREGYLVVTIDAFKHGERIEEPFISLEKYKRYSEVFDVVTTTAEDICMLYCEQYQTTYSTFDMIGVSMGGMIAYYLARKSPHIRYLIPVISSPNFLDLARATIDMDEVEKYQEIIDHSLDYIKSIDPILYQKEWHYKKLFALNTKQDKTVPANLTTQFVKNTTLDHITYKLYDEGHDVSTEMIEDIVSFITEKISHYKCNRL